MKHIIKSSNKVRTILIFLLSLINLFFLIFIIFKPLDELNYVHAFIALSISLLILILYVLVNIKWLAIVCPLPIICLCIINLLLLDSTHSIRALFYEPMQLRFILSLSLFTFFYSLNLIKINLHRREKV